MCMSKGAPKKPAYGPCNESHHQNGIQWAYGGTDSTTSATFSTDNSTYYSTTTADSSTSVSYTLS